MGSTHYITLKNKLSDESIAIRQDICENLAAVVIHWADMHPDYDKFFFQEETYYYENLSKEQREIIFSSDDNEKKIEKLAKYWMDHQEIMVCPDIDKTMTESININFGYDFFFCKTNYHKEFGQLAYAIFYALDKMGYGVVSSDCDKKSEEVVWGKALAEIALRN